MELKCCYFSVVFKVRHLFPLPNAYVVPSGPGIQRIIWRKFSSTLFFTSKRKQGSVIKYGKLKNFSSARKRNFTLLSEAFWVHLVMMRSVKMMFPEAEILLEKQNRKGFSNFWCRLKLMCQRFLLNLCELIWEMKWGRVSMDKREVQFLHSCRMSTTRTGY